MGIGSHGKRMVREDLIGKIGKGTGGKNYKILNITFETNIFYTLLMPIPSGKTLDYTITSEDIIEWIFSLPTNIPIPINNLTTETTATKFPVGILHSSNDIIVAYYEFSSGTFYNRQKVITSFNIISQTNF